MTPYQHLAPNFSSEEIYFLTSALSSTADVGCAQVQSERRRRMCSVPNCARYARTQGFCSTHGGFKTCSIDGCTTGARRKGYCLKHCPEPMMCNFAGCSRKQRSRGFCEQHGGGIPCSIDGCTRSRRKNSLCWIHYFCGTCCANLPPLRRASGLQLPSGI